MNERIAKIEKTMLGVEDHGILTAMLTVNYGGSGQGIGGYTLDEPIRDKDENFLGRRGTAFGMEWVQRCIAACGVESWEQVKGRTVLIVMDSDEWNAKPIGIKPLPTERGKPFMFDELITEMGLR